MLVGDPHCAQKRWRACQSSSERASARIAASPVAMAGASARTSISSVSMSGPRSLLPHRWQSARAVAETEKDQGAPPSI
jgi:hypothetical protein